MKCISSDTNIWLDFNGIRKLDLPFLLPYEYIMQSEVLSEEVISPSELVDELLQLGLKRVELEEDEFFYVYDLLNKYKRVSKNDCIALSIAKKRGIPLLSGDMALRKAAEKEGVTVIGTLWVMDKLLEKRLISDQEYVYYLQMFKENKERRLPEDMIDERINKFKKKGRG